MLLSPKSLCLHQAGLLTSGLKFNCCLNVSILIRQLRFNMSENDILILPKKTSVPTIFPNADDENSIFPFAQDHL